MRRIRLAALITVMVLGSFFAGVAAYSYIDPSGKSRKLWSVAADNTVGTVLGTYTVLPGMVLYGWTKPAYAKYLIVTISMQHTCSLPEENYIDLRLVVDSMVVDEVYFSGRTHDAWQTHTAVFLVPSISTAITYHNLEIQWRLSGVSAAWAAHRVLVVEAFG